MAPSHIVIKRVSGFGFKARVCLPCLQRSDSFLLYDCFLICETKNTIAASSLSCSADRVNRLITKTSDLYLTYNESLISCNYYYKMENVIISLTTE